MKAPTTAIRFSEAKKLLDYGFNTYQYKEFGKKGDLIETINVTKGIQSTVDLVLEEDAGCIMQKGQEKNVVQNVSIEKNVLAPVTLGQKLGEITFSIR